MRGKYIDNMKKNKIIEIIKDVLNENTQTSSARKLINTAERDGHISGMELSANYITDAANKVGAEWDKLKPEEQRVFRDTYYKAFLKKINK